MAWDVLLVGGGSGTGKTLVSRRLAMRFGTTLAQVDDFRLVLATVLPPEIAPGLHFFVDRDLAPLSIEDALAAHRAIGNFMSHAMEPVIAHHVETRTRLVLEGDGILPALATASQHAGRRTAGHVKAIFLEEPDRAALAATMAHRDRGFRNLSVAEQSAMVELQARHGRWLAQEARDAGLPVLPARPTTTLEERIATIVGDPDPRLA